MALTSEAWTSAYNPVERGFAYVKKFYYTQKLRMGANPIYDAEGKNTNALKHVEMIKEAFRRYEDFDFSRVIEE